MEGPADAASTIRKVPCVTAAFVFFLTEISCCPFHFLTNSAYSFVSNCLCRGHTQIVIFVCYPYSGGFSNLRKKTKLKSKGVKVYRNTQGRTYRVPPSFKLARLTRQRKILRKLKAQLTT